MVSSPLTLPWKCSQMASLRNKLSKFSWGSMPPDPPRCQVAQAVPLAPPLYEVYLRPCIDTVESGACYALDSAKATVTSVTVNSLSLAESASCALVRNCVLVQCTDGRAGGPQVLRMRSQRGFRVHGRA